MNTKEKTSASAFALGIDMGGTNTKVAIAAADGTLVAKKSFSTRPFSREKWLRSLRMETLEDAAFMEGRKMAGAGLGIAGLVDPVSKTVFHAPNINGIDGWEIGKALEETLSLPAEIDNDVNAMALGEYSCGEKGKERNMVCLTLGTGVGGGLIIGGKLYRGSGFMAGELGHMTINENGPLCGCGNRGCAEAYLGNDRIVARFRERLASGEKSIAPELVKDVDSLSPRTLYSAAKKGDALSLSVWQEVAGHLGTMLANVINLLNPDRIVLGGGVANAFDLLEKPLWEAIRKRALSSTLRNLSIVTSRLGENAGVIGAASLILKKKEIL